MLRALLPPAWALIPIRLCSPNPRRCRRQPQLIPGVPGPGCPAGKRFLEQEAEAFPPPAARPLPARRAGFAIRGFRFPARGGGASRSFSPHFWHLAGFCCQPRQAPARAGSGSAEGSVHAQPWPRCSPVPRSAAGHGGVKAGARRAAAPGVSPALPAGHAEHPQLPVEHRGPPGPGGHGLCLQGSQQGAAAAGAAREHHPHPWGTPGLGSGRELFAVTINAAERSAWVRGQEEQGGENQRFVCAAEQTVPQRHHLHPERGAGAVTELLGLLCTWMTSLRVYFPLFFPSFPQKSGELVAVKVFNNASYLRPQEVQMREFEMLRKLNHKNIVKLFAVEETGSTKQKVLVMEYCSSGSLLNVLEDPANAFGLAESEFLIVLQCVVAGMNHLRENGVVHRDIKPGNIMRLVGEDGQSIYKLTDFGAARELEDDEKFVSVYGTEEYLHPDVYERAVLRKPQQKAFGVTVDLWSIGVTFYHAATGSLPFLPFGGPRRNKEIMYKITTEKPPGAIAGIQRQENGTIEWSYELPITCRLSAGLKDQLIPILANILEVDQDKCWGFDQFFAGTNDILHRMVVDVFSLQQASSHRIYIHSYNTTTKFLDAVFKQTNIAPHHQEYFFEGHLYELDPNLQARNFCKTTESSPLTLLSTSEQPEDVVGVRYRDPALEFPKFAPRVDVVADCSAAKSAVGAAHQTLRVGRALRRARELLARGLHWVIGNLRTECSRILEQRRGAHSVLTCLQLTQGKTHVLCEAVPAGSRGPAGAEVVKRLQRVDEELSQCSRSIFDFQGALDGILAELVKDRQQVHEDKSIQQMECCLEKMQVIYRQFKKARTCLRLGYNEEQIHKLDKLNLGSLARKVLSIFQNDCVQQYQEALALHSSRMRKVCEIKKHLKRLSNRISTCSVEMMECQGCLQAALNRLLQTEKWDLAPPAPSPVPLSQEMALRMQELLEQMRSVTCDLQFNNSIIERLGGAAPTPSV